MEMNAHMSLLMLGTPDRLTTSAFDGWLSQNDVDVNFTFKHPPNSHRSLSILEYLINGKAFALVDHVISLGANVRANADGQSAFSLAFCSWPHELLRLVKMFKCVENASRGSLAFLSTDVFVSRFFFFFVRAIALRFHYY
jgi:hypothetical protein